MTKSIASYWPQSVAHLATPYLNEHDQEVVTASISSDPVNGCVGFSQLYTALIPLKEVDEVLDTPGGIGWQVDSWGPRPVVPLGQRFDASFWVRGLDDRQYETIIESWRYHNNRVLLPANGLLMCYGLVPRYLKDGEVCWDDPSKPVYDVVRVRPLSKFTVMNSHTPAGVVIRRDYLEDCLSLTECAAIDSYLRLIETLERLADSLGLYLSSEDIGQLDLEMVDYDGWWKDIGLRSLGCVALSDLNREKFINRCIGLYNLLDLLKPGPLKQILRQLGMSRDDMDFLGGFGSVKLLGVICQLAHIACRDGEDLVGDFHVVLGQWDRASKVLQLAPLFALIELWDLGAHTVGQEAQGRLERALDVFKIDQQSTRKGWGLALDNVYDAVADALRFPAQLIDSSYSDHM